MKPVPTDRTGKVYCQVCGATMTCTARVNTKKTFKLRRYVCDVDPDHIRSVITNDNTDENPIIQLGLKVQETYFKRQERNQYEQREENTKKPKRHT